LRFLIEDGGKRAAPVMPVAATGLPGFIRVYPWLAAPID